MGTFRGGSSSIETSIENQELVQSYIAGKSDNPKFNNVKTASYFQFHLLSGETTVRIDSGDEITMQEGEIWTLDSNSIESFVITSSDITFKYYINFKI